MYKILLHATDLNTNHYALCQQALHLAEKLQARLHLLHVIEQPTSLQLAQSLGFAELVNPAIEDVRQIMAVLGDDLGIPKEQQHVEVGSTHQHILEAVAKYHCDLIILGSHTPTGVPLFLGSTAHAIMHHAPCDVLTLRATAP